MFRYIGLEPSHSRSKYNNTPFKIFQLFTFLNTTFEEILCEITAYNEGLLSCAFSHVIFPTGMYTVIPSIDDGNSSDHQHL